MADEYDKLAAKQAHTQAFKLLSEPLSLSLDKWLGPLVPNPHRRWWQFWKPKMVREVPKLPEGTSPTLKFRRLVPFPDVVRGDD